MTKEETASFIRAYLDGDTAVGNIIPIRDVLESAFTYLKEQPSLPANLDEAAQKHVRGYHPAIQKMCMEEFVAGVRWQAGQGQSFETKITNVGIIILPKINIQAGDNVVVQIRKK